MKLRNIPFIWNLWPPFLGLGIAIKSISDDQRKISMILKKRFWNLNFFGTQYGGGIFAMTDGVHALMLLKNLPKDYFIWDKSAKIDYLKRGTSHLTADFVITERDLEEIRKNVAESDSYDWTTSVEIKDSSDQVVAKVDRVISIKAKNQKSSTIEL